MQGPRDLDPLARLLWIRRIATQEGAQIVGEILSERPAVIPDADRLAWAEGDFVYGLLLQICGDDEQSLAHLERAAATYRALGTGRQLIDCLIPIAALVGRRDNVRGLAIPEECLAIAEEWGDTHGIVEVKVCLAELRLGRGELDGADRLLVAGTQYYARLRSKSGICWTLGLSARIAARRGDRKRAIDLMDQVVDVARALRVPYQVLKVAAYALNDLGIIAAQRRKWRESRYWYLRSLALGRELGDRSLVANENENVGMTLLARRYPEIIPATLAIERGTTDRYPDTLIPRPLGGADRDAARQVGLICAACEADEDRRGVLPP